MNDVTAIRLDDECERIIADLIKRFGFNRSTAIRYCIRCMQGK